MPEILHKCVEEVMAKGKDEQSAYAICRTSLGLQSDGTEDGKPLEIPEEEMRAKVEMALAFQGGTVVRKRMVVAKPIGEYVNGPQKGKLTAAVLRKFVENQQKQPRQIKIFLNGAHPKSNDERPADGWAEGLSINDAGELVADSKLMGTAADWVATDRIRGASIYAIPGTDYKGNPIGPVLKHILLSDEGYITDLNVAARGQGSEMPVIAFTALKSKEATMADDPKKTPPADPPDPESMALKVKTLEGLVEEKMRENQELTAANANLLADVERFKSSPGLSEAANQIAALTRQNRANTIRRKVKDGVAEGRFDRVMVGDPKTGYDHPSDEGVLLWFKTSIFKDSEDKLDFALVSFPKKTIGRVYPSGVPVEPGEITLTQEDKDRIRSLGHDPDQVIAAMKAKDVNEYVALTSKKE